MDIKHFLNSDLNLIENEPVAKHSTFRVGGPAQYYVEPTVPEAVELIACLRKEGIPFTILGNGSNILVSDKGLPGVVISLAKPAAKFTVSHNDSTIIAQAGVLLSQLAAAAADAGLTGLEFAAGIPGSLGGALIMNAGAYGGEMKDVVTEVEVLTTESKIIQIPADKADFSYRHSAMMDDGSIILSAVLQLKPAEDPEQIRARMAELAAARKEKQPLEFPSAGSTFKRPQGHFAGKLIQDAGLAGYSVGGAQVSPKHCGFVVNTGGATAEDVHKLMQHVIATVDNQFGVRLEPEVRLLGEF